MKIREAIPADIPAISTLLEQQGHPVPAIELAVRLKQFSRASMSAVFVYQVTGRPVGLIVLHLVPQLLLAGDVVLISCLAVDPIFSGTGIAAELEEFACAMGRKGKAARIALDHSPNQPGAKPFYTRLGYTPSKNYLIKNL
jgi:predicted N-acetyltransferase YhbS